MSVFSDRTELSAFQLQRLNALVTEISASNAFYASRLPKLPFTSLEDYTTRLPFTTKAELVADQKQNPPYGTNLTYSLKHYTRFNQTSGTSGTPLRWLDTDGSWAWMVENWRRVLELSEVISGDKIFFAFSFGPFLGFWTAFEAGIKHGCLCIPGGGLSTLGRLKTVMENEVTVLCCTPTYAIRLGEEARKEGIDLSKSSVRVILVAGEPGANIPTTRQRIEGLWGGAQVKDHHGMTEIGPVSYACPHSSEVLHILETEFLPEVVDPLTLEPVPVGGQGELVLTNFGRSASPLLRYRTGDLVQASSEPCGCGTLNMGLLGGIRGRVDDMVVVRGVNLHPSAVEAVLNQFQGIAEYRVALYTERSMWEVAIQIEPSEEVSSPNALRDEVEAALRATFNLRIPVVVVSLGTLPRFEMKSRRWVRTDLR